MSSLVYDASSGTFQYVVGSSGVSKTVVKVNTIAERNALTSKKQLVLVMNAYADDPTVNTGWAIYAYNTDTEEWVKIQEQESMDLAISLDALGITYNASEINTAVGNQHAHKTTGNYTYSDGLYGCAEGVSGYTGFVKVDLPDNATSIDYFITSYYNMGVVVNNKPYYMSTSAGNYSGELTDISVGGTVTLNNVSVIAFSTESVAAINAGSLYVRGLTAKTYAASGTLRGVGNYSTSNISSSVWSKIGTGTNWKQVKCLRYGWAMLRGDGDDSTLYLGGYNVCKLMGPATSEVDSGITGDTNSVFGKVPYLLNTPTAVSITENGVTVTPTDWIDIQTGGNFMGAVRKGSVVTRPTWMDGNTSLQGGKIYLWGRNWCGEIGNGVHYIQDMTTAQAVEYGFATPCDIGQDTPVPLTVRTYGANYDADTNPTDYTDTVHDDWVKFSAGWYHSVALRYNAQGESEVYVWGSNEYGQMGNGNFVPEGETQSNLSETVAATIEYVDRPRLLTTEFPYKDVVNVQATHYGTILTRKDGSKYFAGCNKRNNLGISSLTSVQVFVPYFTKMSSFYESGDWYAETYGGFIIRHIPQLTSTADVSLRAMMVDDFECSKLSDAVVFSHHHALNTEDLDAVVLATKAYLPNIPSTVNNSHIHANIATLGALTSSNGVLLLNGSPIVGAASDGSTSVSIDASNVKLDNLADVVGLSNIAGGMGLEVMSYYEDASSKAYLRLCPVGNGAHTVPRWMPIYNKVGTTYTELVSADTLSAGYVAIIYTTSAKTVVQSTNIVNSVGDLKNILNTISGNTNYTADVYYLNAASGSAWTTGTLSATITSASLRTLATAYKAGTLYYKPTDGSDYLPLSEVPSVSIPSFEAEDLEWFDVYNAAGTVIYSESNFEANTLYFADGTEVTCAAIIAVPISYTTSGDTVIPVYGDVYTNNTASGTPVISSATIAAGLYRKEGSSYLKIGIKDVVEKFDTSLFPIGGTVYVLPCKNDFTGVANQAYTIESVNALNNSSSNLESIIVKLTSVVTTDTSSTFYPGSVSDPMLAVVPSPYRGYTSQVSGEYNSAIGQNASAFGNSNDVFGNQATAFGIGNTVSGFNSHVFGCNNSVVGGNSFVVGGSNEVGGEENFVYGTANFAYGYYGMLIGSRNFTYGVNDVTIGFTNQIMAERALTIGSKCTINKGADDSFVLGMNITNSAKRAIVIGKAAIIPDNEGNFPDNDTSPTLTAAAFANAGYNASGDSNTEALIFCMGEKITGTDSHPFVAATYRKYMWVANNDYFAATATSTARASKESRFFIPVHKWDFNGTAYINFVTPALASTDTNGNESYSYSTREGGRVKSCDAGLVITTAGGSVVLDWFKASRFKIKASTTTAVTPSLVNMTGISASYAGDVSWPDGAEGTILVYGGTNISWPSGWVWTNAVPASVVSSAATSFAMVRIEIVDSTVVATTLVG